MAIVRKWIERLFSVSKESAKLTPVESSHHVTGVGIAEKEQGDRYLTSGDFAAAAQCYRRAIEIDQHYAKAHCNLGFALKEQGLLKEAERCFTQALLLDPTLVDAHYLLGVLRQADDQLDAALAHYRKALELAPDFENAYLDACLLLAQQKRMGEATQLMQAGIRQNPTYANLHFYLGNIHNELE
ncbi:MAG TPA: tetratricopeptide repeat protein, partial [Burkholderiaceae bacterium]|nr:tetratricopeptide repeat protein [Burkholderiaceae bacterium]